MADQREDVGCALLLGGRLGKGEALQLGRPHATQEGGLVERELLGELSDEGALAPRGCAQQPLPVVNAKLGGATSERAAGAASLAAATEGRHRPRAAATP